MSKGGRREREIGAKSLDTVFQPEFIEDLDYWVKENVKTAEKIFRLIEDIKKNPFIGLGKPEHVKYLGPDVWSRRITQEHRIVYKVSADRIDFLQCRYHY